MKQWKKEDFKSKYITISSEEEGKSTIKFLESLGIIPDGGMCCIYQKKDRAIFIFSSFSWKYTTTNSEDYKFSDLQLEEKQEILTIEQLIEGEVYITEYEDQGEYIFKATDNNNYCSFINTNWFSSLTGDIRPSNGFKTFKKASKEQKDWLNICIQENKFIEFNEINNYMNKETKFEVGDWVIASYKNGCIGYRGKLAKVLNNFSYQYEDGTIENNHSNFQFEGVRKALSHEIPNNSSVNTFNFEKGKYYLIEAYLQKTQYYIQFERQDSDKGIFGGYRVLDSNNWFNLGGFTNVKLIKEVTEQEAKGLPKQELSLLEQAKLKYSEGIKFKTMLSGNIHISKGTIFSANDFEISMNIEKNLGYSNAVVYKNGKWAEIVKQENNSIPEYVECIKTFSNNYIVGKIYKTRNGNVIGEEGDAPAIYGLNKDRFPISTKEAYLKQEGKTEWSQFTNNFQSNSCNISVDPYKNEEIEVGDLVEIISEYDNSTKLPKGSKYVVEEIIENSAGFWYRKIKGSPSGAKLTSIKLIKKKHSNTTVNKQLDISSAIQVGNEVTNITIPKSASVVLKNTENEVKIKINQKLTIKI